jgi:Mor family transcriptional regulator
MQNSQVSLTSFLLNLNKTLEQGLVLNKGEVVSGLVQEVKPDGMLALLIKGKLVEAFSEVSVSQGQQVFLSVEDFREGRTYLKLLTPEALGQQREAGLALNLQRLGIDSGEVNLAIAKKLIQYQLPVSRENIMEASRAIKILGGYSQENTEVAVLTRAAGLPSNEPILKALASFLKEPGDVGRLAGRLVQLLGAMPEEPPAFGPAAMRSTRPETDGQAGPNVKPPAVPSGNADLPAPVKPIPVPGAPLEQARGQAIPQPPGQAVVFEARAVPEETGGIKMVSNRPAVEAEALPTSTSNPLSGGSPDLLTQARSMIRTLLTDLIIRFNEDPGYNAQKMEARPRETADLVRDLNNLQSVLKKSFPNARPEVQQILAGLESLEKELSGQQILNSLARTTMVQENYPGLYYLSFPVQVEQGVKQVQIRVRHDGSGKQNLKEADRLSLVVGLDTGQMGKVVFHADWARAGSLSIMGVVENQAVGQYLEEGLPGLIEALGELGYQVNNRGISVARDMEKEADLHPLLVDAQEEPSLVAIDITV